MIVYTIAEESTDVAAVAKQHGVNDRPESPVDSGHDLAPQAQRQRRIACVSTSISVIQLSANAMQGLSTRFAVLIIRSDMEFEIVNCLQPVRFHDDSL